MAALRAAAASIFLTGCHGSAMNRNEWFLRDSLESFRLEELAGQGTSYPELWYQQQKVDHFDTSDQRTFSQRYFANFDHFKPGGPIFLMIGGEGPLSDRYVGNGLAGGLFAEKLGGATVAVEHRFYGKTQPFDSLATDNLYYLTSRQALHDLAQFQTWFATSNSSLKDSRFFCMGGSYPGNLAAWYRLEFPNMTSGCWAASGPVHAQEDWPGFGEKVWRAVATNTLGVRDDSVSMKLYAGYQQLAGLIQDPTPAAHQKLVKLFNVCPGTLVSQADRDNMETAISTYPGLIMQYNNTKTPRLAAIREIVIKAATALDAAVGVSEFLNLTKGLPPNNCTDNSIGAMYTLLMDTSLPQSGYANAMRTWTWQTCNEFGYFQTGTSEFDQPTMYTRGASARALWQQVCNDVFAINDASIGARIQATNDYYGGKNPRDISHVFFSNGDLDAWSLLSVTSYPPNDREVYTEVAPLGSHCVGLYQPMEGEVPGATAIRNKALELFQKWGAMSRSADFIFF